MAEPDTVYLVDASPYVFRAYFSLPDSIRTPAGEPIHAAYGFASFLLKLIADEAPSHLAVAFDESLTTSFRNDLYPDYKAQRELPPAELEAQLGACRELADAFGAATFADAVYEADDIVATLAEQATAAGLPAVVVSGDKDLAQLVGDGVTLYDFAREERLGPAEVMERFGCRPEQVAELLALQGDAVDNIPGVPGVGKKTARALLAAFDDLDDLYARLDEVPDLALRGAARWPPGSPSTATSPSSPAASPPWCATRRSPATPPPSPSTAPTRSSSTRCSNASASAASATASRAGATAERRRHPAGRQAGSSRPWNSAGGEVASTARNASRMR